MREVSSAQSSPHSDLSLQQTVAGVGGFVVIFFKIVLSELVSINDTGV